MSALTTIDLIDLGRPNISLVCKIGINAGHQYLLYVTIPTCDPLSVLAQVDVLHPPYTGYAPRANKPGLKDVAMVHIVYRTLPMTLGEIPNARLMPGCSFSFDVSDLNPAIPTLPQPSNISQNEYYRLMVRTDFVSATGSVASKTSGLHYEDAEEI